MVAAIPLGVLAGTYLAEYGRTSKLGDVIRFCNDILLSGAFNYYRVIYLWNNRAAVQTFFRLGRGRVGFV